MLTYLDELCNGTARACMNSGYQVLPITERLGMRLSTVTNENVTVMITIQLLPTTFKCATCEASWERLAKLRTVVTVGRQAREKPLRSNKAIFQLEDSRVHPVR